jgi:carbamoyltransferase
MIVLGINYYFHDSSACLLVDGKLVAVMEEERLTRQKHTSAFPEQAIASCFKIAGLDLKDVDHIALSIKPTKDWMRKMPYCLGHLSQSRPFLKQELLHGYYKQRGFWGWLNSAFPAGKRPQVHFVPHHLSHAAGTFLVSPHDRAALLSLDGSGEWATSLLGTGEGIDVKQFQKSYFPMSLGAVYEAATEFCGFKPNYDEGKTMGLAPFGDPSVFYKKVSDIISVDDRGAIRVDLSYFSYQFWGAQRCGRKFHEVFGAPRKSSEDFKQHHRDVAAAFQKVLEECALKLCRFLRKRTDARHLVIAGGVALNSVMNGRLLREGGFDDIYVMPAAGDNGTAIGAAAYVYHALLRRPRVAQHDDPYLGTSYSERDLEKLLRDCKLPVNRPKDIVETTAQLLAEGNIVGWFQGRMEVGPRALGNRSILADPTGPAMKDKINSEVKHREAFRPFAPSVAVEDQNRYFESKGESPFMLMVCDVIPAMRQHLPAITHVDGTARLQTVNAAVNPLYHRLLRKFGEKSKPPVLLNTSFNIQGEPIVESPSNAIRCFYSTGLDYLVLGNFLLGKS